MTTIYIRLAAAIALVAALIFGWHTVTSRYDRQGYERRAAEDKAAAEAQTAMNRDLQRQAELRYVVQSGVREKFFVTTVREIHEAAAPLAACPVPDRVVRLLNDANACASGDRPASCGAAGEVPGSR